MKPRPFSQSRRMRPRGSAAQRESTTTSTARPWPKRPTSAANKGGKRATSPLRSDRISTAQRERRSDESGIVGLEVLPLLVVVFVVGTLVFAQSWMALDAKIAATAGAREAARTFAEHPADRPERAAEAASRAGLRAMSGHGLAGTARVVAIGAVSNSRCARVTFEATYEVPRLALPSRGWRQVTVRARSTETVDPFRHGLDGRARCIA